MSLLTTMITPAQDRKLHWGSAYGLWAVAAFKITGLTMIDIFIIQAFDNDLKTVLKSGKEKLIIPHIERIQKFMEDEKISAPTIPSRKNLQSIQNQLEANSIITDNEIAIDIYTIMKEGLRVDTVAISEALRPDVRKFALDIFNEDYRAFDNAVHLFTKKNWIQAAPTV